MKKAIPLAESALDYKPIDYLSRALTPKWERNRLLRLSLLCALAWGLIAHAYAFLHDAFSHDSLMIYADSEENVWKVELGRFLVPAYRFLTRGSIELPWLIGLVALLWLGLAVYFVAVTFRVRSKWGVALLSGVMVTNVTVSAIAGTYLYELDFDMLSVLLPVLAVFLWKQNRYGFLWGSLCICATLGIYQCNICVAVVLMMLDCIFSLLRGEDTWETVRRGLMGIVMLALGAALYGVALRAVLAVTHIQLAHSYNSIANLFAAKRYALPELVSKLYQDAVVKNLLLHKRLSRFKCFVLPLFALTLGLLGRAIWLKRPRARNVALALVLFLLLPLGANLAVILNDGRSHDLMKYAVWLLLTLPVLLWHAIPGLAVDLGDRALLKKLASLLLCVILFQNLVLSNSIYLKRDLEQEAVLSCMTRVVYDLNEVEGYVPGQTPVCFAGVPDPGRRMTGFEPITRFTGMGYGALSYYEPIENYCRYVLNLDIALVSESECSAISAGEAVEAMPVYPAEGSIQWVNDVVVVKLG